MPIVGIASSLVIWAATSPGHHLHHHRERAGRLERLGVVEQPLRGVAAALHPVAAEAVLGLRREADVRHHRDARTGQQLDLRCHLATALELHRVRVGLLHEADGGVVRLLRRGLVGAEREVGDHERAATERVTARTRGSSSSTVTGSEVSLP